MRSEVFICFIATFVTAGVGCFAVLRPDRSVARWLFLAGMGAFSLESGVAAGGMLAGHSHTAVFWRELRLIISSCIPGIWLAFSLVFSRGNPSASLNAWRPLLVLAVGASLLVLVGTAAGMVLIDGTFEEAGVTLFHLSRWGFAIYILLLLGSVFVLMNLERTFRASVGKMRWRIKFMILALFVVFGVRIYTGSQVLLYSHLRPVLESFEAVSLLVACGLMVASFARAGFREVEVYPSGALLQSSVTLFISGSYLLIVGGLAKLLTMFGNYGGLPMKALVILISLVLLSLLLLSDKMRERSRRLISQHLKRPLHNYRQVWMSFAERTSSLLNETDLSRAVTTLVSDIFQVLSVTIWLIDENQKLVFGASTSLLESDSRSLVPDDLNRNRALTGGMAAHPYPLNVENAEAEWIAALKRHNASFFHGRENGLCMPLVARDEVLGLICLGDRVNHVPFSAEDLDLLKCLGDQVAANLLNLQLSQKLLRAKQLEAFQAMSAFFVHDLKNTAHSLSLLLQNLPTHFQDPAFKEDAHRAVFNSVRRLNELVGCLATLRQKLEIHPTEVDLNDVVTSALKGMHLPAKESIERDFHKLPAVLADAEHLQKVVTNLVLNAREAMENNQGKIEIATDRKNDWAIVSVRDHGRGMSPEFIQKQLFRPFQTTKKNGIGIGMFHSKMIVEAHRGKIEVESEAGKGTTVRVLLPLRRS